MRRFILFLALLAVAVGLGAFSYLNPGYVVLAVGHAQVGLPLWLAIAALIVLFVSIWVGLALIRAAWKLPQHVTDYWGQRQRQKNEKYLVDGVNSFLIEDWDQAATRFKQLSKGRFLPTQMASMSAWCRAKYAGADQQAWLDDLPQGKDSDLTTVLLQVDACIKGQDYNEAVSLMTGLNAQQARNPNVQKRVMKAALGLDDYSAAEKALKALTRSKALSAVQIEHYQTQILQGQLAWVQDTEALKNIWDKSPKALRKKGNGLLLYVKALIRLDARDRASATLEGYLKKTPDDALFNYYCQQDNDLDTRLNFAKLYLKRHSVTAESASAIAGLYHAQGHIKQAKQYYELSLSIAPEPQTYKKLSALMKGSRAYTEALTLLEKATL